MNTSFARIAAPESRGAGLPVGASVAASADASAGSNVAAPGPAEGGGDVTGRFAALLAAPAAPGAAGAPTGDPGGRPAGASPRAGEADSIDRDREAALSAVLAGQLGLDETVLQRLLAQGEPGQLAQGRSGQPARPEAGELAQVAGLAGTAGETRAAASAPGSPRVDQPPGVVAAGVAGAMVSGRAATVGAIQTAGAAPAQSIAIADGEAGDGAVVPRPGIAPAEGRAPAAPHGPSAFAAVAAATAGASAAELAPVGSGSPVVAVPAALDGASDASPEVPGRQGLRAAAPGVDAPAADAPVAARKPADGAPLGRLAVSPVEGEMALARAVPAHAPPARHDGGALPTAAGGRSDGLPRAFAGAPGPDVTPGAQIDRDASVAQRSRAAATAPGDSLADDAAAEPDPGLARVGRLRETDREADGATAARIAASSAALRDTGAGASGPVLRAGTAEPSMPATPGASLAPDPSLAPPRAVQTVDLSAAVSREPSSAADALHRGREHYVELGQRLADAIGGRISAQVARGAWSVEIRLLPASLGAVQVRLARDGARIVARLEASEGSTRDLLAEGAARLRDCLAQAGVDAVEVQVGLEQRGDRGKNTAFAGSAGNVKIGSRSTEESEVPARRPDTGVHRLDVLV